MYPNGIYIDPKVPAQGILLGYMDSWRGGLRVLKHL